MLSDSELTIAEAQARQTSLMRKGILPCGQKQRSTEQSIVNDKEIHGRTIYFSYKKLIQYNG